jgi:hypothetical protein
VDRWEVTGLGFRLAATRIAAPIPRSKGDEIVARLIEAARSINADDLANDVERLLVFGSWANSAEELGDIDVVAELRKRVIAGRDLDEEASQRLRARKQHRKSVSVGGSGQLLALAVRDRRLSMMMTQCLFAADLLRAGAPRVHTKPHGSGTILAFAKTPAPASPLSPSLLFPAERQRAD